MIDVLGKLRMNGDLDWDLVLDLTREFELWEMFESPREARAAMRETYDEDRWLGQPYYPVMIVEKDTMVPTCRPMAMRLQMPFASSRGYSSLRLQYDVAKALNERHARTGQQAIIYTITDLDPSGLDLHRAWVEALQNFNAPVADFVRLGLTREQVAALADPVLRQGIEVKPSDSRARAYVEQYGTRCWETDILPPAVIERELARHIKRWRDWNLWCQRDAEVERARGRL